uniref:cation:proton antiporter domain-containing protein n=2 Tax=Oculatella sp. LEGE 06141 TaxID=1828648 RepID=UPI0030DCD893
MEHLWFIWMNPWYERMASIGLNSVWNPVTHPTIAQLVEPITDPVAVFLVIMAIMLVAPLLFERLRMPGIIGLILAGVIVGPYGLGVLERDSTIVLLGTVGLLFLMFLGGLETSLDDLKRNAGKAVTFGLLTFAIPMIFGTAVMLLLQYSFLASILVASCLASHTLVALPILARLGIMRAPSVTATLGGTIITNVLALLVLAVVVKANEGNLTLNFWLFLIPSLAIYTFATLWGVPKLGRWFFRQFGHDESAEFLFVLAALFVVSYIAGLIEIEPIVGAFLAGIAITQIIPQLSPLMNRIQFIGNTLFVPFFLISVGMLVDPLILVKEPRSILVAGVIVAAELASKFLAAWVPGKFFFKWPFPSTMVTFGLSVAQAASTLAAITVAFNIELVDELTVNGIIVMILVSCIASPWITERWGKQMKPEIPAATQQDQHQLGDRVLVPVANPNTEDNLLQLAIILAKGAGGTLLPFHILADQGGRIPAEAKIQQQQLLDAAVAIAHSAVANVEPIGRVDDSIDLGIVRAANERNASLVICGWKGYSTYRDNFFGSVLDNVVRLTTMPVLITRFPQPIENTQRVLLALSDVEESSPRYIQTLALAKTLAAELKAPLHLLDVSRSGQHKAKLDSAKQDDDISVEQLRGTLVGQVFKLLREGDLLMLIADTYRVGQPVMGRQPEAIARKQPETPMIIVHFPN